MDPATTNQMYPLLSPKCRPGTGWAGPLKTGLTASRGETTAAQEVKQLSGALAKGRKGLEGVSFELRQARVFHIGGLKAEP